MMKPDNFGSEDVFQFLLKHIRHILGTDYNFHRKWNKESVTMIFTKKNYTISQSECYESKVHIIQNLLTSFHFKLVKVWKSKYIHQILVRLNYDELFEFHEKYDDTLEFFEELDFAKSNIEQTIIQNELVDIGEQLPDLELTWSDTNTNKTHTMSAELCSGALTYMSADPNLCKYLITFTDISGGKEDYQVILKGRDFADAINSNLEQLKKQFFETTDKMSFDDIRSSFKILISEILPDDTISFLNIDF